MKNTNLPKSIIALLVDALPGKLTLTAASSLAGLEAGIRALISDRQLTITGLTAERDKAKKLVGLIEGFAKSKGLDLVGIDKFKAVPEVPEGEGAGNILSNYEAITDPIARTKFYRLNKAALEDAHEESKRASNQFK